MPWLSTSLVLAQKGLYILALPFSFMFFLTGLRQVHNAYHYALGVSKKSTEQVMLILSALMLGSMHALQLTHLYHHKHCMDEDDVEAASARVSGLGALLLGPVFPIQLHVKALAIANSRRRLWIWSELIINAVIVFTVFVVLRVPCLKYHFVAMAIGQCLTAFVAVWTVHHGCDGTTLIARTLRHRVKSLIAFDMFYHTEHHLFPRVPTCHLAQLAERLDVVVPEVQKHQVY